MVSAMINNRKENSSSSNDDDISNDNNDDHCFCHQTYLNDLPLVESNKKDDENENENENEDDDDDDHDDNNGNNNSKKTVTVVDEDPSSFSNNNNNNNNNNNTEVKSSVHLCSCPPLIGMYKDLKARIPLYANDWKLPQSKKSLFTILNATIFAFIIQLIPALIFAELLDKTTNGSLSVAETLLSAGIIGILYSILSGQPLVLIGITGPVAILLGTSYRLAAQFNSDYWPFFWWLCIWTSILHLITAMVGLVNLVWVITPFTTQIFEFFIASTFIYESIRDLFQPIQLNYSTNDLLLSDIDATTNTTNTTRELSSDVVTDPNEGGGVLERSSAYAGLVIGIGTFYLCWILHFAETWQSFNTATRSFLASYNMMISLIVMTSLSYIPGVDQGITNTNDTGEQGKGSSNGGLERVRVEDPWDWQPTDVNRNWIVNPFDGITTEGIFGALFPAFMLYLLFFIDHNISSILTQSPKYNLKKPPAYHWDFFVLGLTIIPCGLLGLPPGSGLIPQAPLHTRALCTKKYEIIHGRQHEVFIDCEEQRWSAFFQAALMFVALSCMKVISWIPTGCLFGIFLYLGVGAMRGNEIWERITLMFLKHTERPKIPVVTKTSRWSVVVAYTAVQVLLAGITFGISQFVSWGYVFPALIAGFVPFRSFVINHIFDENDLLYLDPVTETDADFITDLIDYDEGITPKRTSEFGLGLSEFRTSGVPHDADEYYEKHPEIIDQYSFVGGRHSCEF